MNGKIGCLGWAAIAFVLILAINYWYIALAIAAIGGGLYYWHRKNTAPQRAEDAKEREREIAELKSQAIVPLDESYDAGVLLKSNEILYFKSDYTVNWNEERTHTTKVNYSGVTSSVKIMKGVYWRAGSVKPMREKTTQMETIHSGKLLLTNKRLMVLANDGSTSQVMYSGISNISPYSDGFGIMKNRGKNVFITGNDGEKLSILVIRLITGDLHSHAIQTVTQPDKKLEDASDHITAREIFDAAKDSTDVPTRLDEKNKFYDLSFNDEKVSTIALYYNYDSQKTREKLQGFVDSAVELSSTLSKKLENDDYAVRGYIGESDFDTLFIQARNGKTEYYLLDDPKFQKLVNDYVSTSEPNNNSELDASDSDVTTQLRQLKQLVDEGVITQDDFEAKKKQLLGI